MLRKRALDEAKGHDVGEAEREMGRSSAPSEVSSFATSRTLLEAIGLENTGTISKTSINKMKLINKHLGLHNHVDTFEQLKRTKVPVLKALNLSRNNTQDMVSSNGPTKLRHAMQNATTQ